MKFWMELLFKRQVEQLEDEWKAAVLRAQRESRTLRNQLAEKDTTIANLQKKLGEVPLEGLMLRTSGGTFYEFPSGTSIDFNEESRYAIVFDANGDCIGEAKHVVAWWFYPLVKGTGA